MNCWRGSLGCWRGPGSAKIKPSDVTLSHHPLATRGRQITPQKNIRPHLVIQLTAKTPNPHDRSPGLLQRD